MTDQTNNHVVIGVARSGHLGMKSGDDTPIKGMATIARFEQTEEMRAVVGSAINALCIEDETSYRIPGIEEGMDKDESGDLFAEFTIAFGNAVKILAEATGTEIPEGSVFGGEAAEWHFKQTNEGNDYAPMAQ